MFCLSGKSGNLFLGLCSSTLTKSTQWVRVWSCWACNLTHRRVRSVMEGEREETERVLEVSRCAIGCWAVYCYSPLEQSWVWHYLILKLLFCFCFVFHFLHVVTGSQSAFLNALPSFWSFSGLLTLVTFKLSLPLLLFFFTSPLCSALFITYSIPVLVCPCLTCMLKSMMPGLVSLLPTQTERSISLFCLLWFLSLHKLRAFLALPKPEPRKIC